MDRLPFRDYTLYQIRSALKDVVQDEDGTGKLARVADVEVAGKTGTSQVVRLHKRPEKGEVIPFAHRDHALFVAYAPVHNPEIALAVIVEHAEAGGGKVAAPIASEVLDAYFKLKQRRENPSYAQVRSTTSISF